ncbi:ATP-dependent zinc metalloprotease YME1L1 [Ophiophagus hannah]|uniref:ATP-dependent zinc metalloprotease YME1L1 n=1 Tax=Ophiophagus hannah TaxID=8665 RepID=V8NX30_OPHHA|nr:ATP-dependent zinc metalloprotease YME1L1 [Ophiophagus hannah]
MLSFSTTVQPQSVQKEAPPEHDVLSPEPLLNLRDLGLGDLKISQLDEVVNKLIPGFGEENKIPSHWQTSYISAESFFENKYGFADTFRVLRSSYLYRQHLNPPQSICSSLQYWPVFIQSRGFKTLKSRARRLQSTSEHSAEAEDVAPSFVKGLLLREKVSEIESLDKLMKRKNIPEAHQDAFKTGFAEGFLKSQALAQRTIDSLRRTRLFVFLAVLFGIYTVLKSQFLPKGSFSDAVRFRASSGLDAAVDPIQMKNITFEHVKGVDEAKQELQEIVEFLKNPQKFTILGGKLPKGVLLVGPPGTGKTLLARAVAGEADVPFYYASGSEFDEMFVGVGASRIRNLFKEAKANAPSVIFIDELDSVGGKRVESPMHPYSKQTINQLLAEMDGFKSNEGIIIIGATNFPEALDKPDVKGRTEILKWYLNKIKYDKCPERRSVEIGDKNKTITAYHESGHAIIAYYTKDAMPINKATIMPRGPTLGHVSLLPESDRWNETRSQLLAQMDVSMGGRVAEELIFGSDHITTGSSNDFENATRIAQLMVTRFGMSDKLGVMTYRETTNFSPETQSAIEQEIRTLLKESYERAKSILKVHAKEHKNLAEALLTYETLDAKEIQIVLEGKKLEVR